MGNRHHHAIMIQEGGPCNLTAVTKELVGAIEECRSENIAPEKDAAVRLILHHMAHIANVAEFHDLDSYAKAKHDCLQHSIPHLTRQARLQTRFDAVAHYGAFQHLHTWQPHECTMVIDFSDYIFNGNEDGPGRGMSGTVDLSIDSVIIVKVYACTIDGDFVWHPTNCGHIGKAREKAREFVNYLRKQISRVSTDHIVITVNDDPDLV